MTKITQYSAINLYPEVIVDADTWNRFPTPDRVDRTIKAAEECGITVLPVDDGNEAMAAIKRIIPHDGEVMAGSSTTLIKIGFEEYAAGHLILVVGINKIVPMLEDALKRVRLYAYPLENVRAKKVYGTPSVIGKCSIISHEKVEGWITMILAKESLGY